MSKYQMSQASPLTPAQLRAAVELLHEVHDEIEGTQLRTGPRQTIWLHTNSQVSDWLNQIIDNPEDLLRRDAEAEATTREDAPALGNDGLTDAEREAHAHAYVTTGPGRPTTPQERADLTTWLQQRHEEKP